MDPNDKHEHQYLTWVFLRGAYHLVNITLYLVFYAAAMLFGYLAFNRFGGLGLFSYVTTIAVLRLAYDIRKIKAGEVSVPPEYQMPVEMHKPHAFSKAGRRSNPDDGSLDNE